MCLQVSLDSQLEENQICLAITMHTHVMWELSSSTGHVAEITNLVIFKVC